MAEQQTGPVRRSDNIGILAWRLVGDIGSPEEYSDEWTPPDPTAAPALYDALTEAGMFDMAYRLQMFIIGFATAGMVPGPMHGGDPAMNFRYSVFDTLRPILFDLNWACLEAARMLTPVVPEVQEGKSEINTVRFTVNHPAQPGMVVENPQGGRVMVIAVHDDGSITGVPLQDANNRLNEAMGMMEGQIAFMNRPVGNPYRRRR